MCAFLRLFGAAFVLAGLLHVIYGVGAELMLGTNLSAEALTNPSLDSQNRFYGAAFAVYGVLFWMCAGDMTRYAPVLRVMLVVFFFAGVARLIAVALYGLPAPAIQVLAATELIFPPLLLWWQSRHLRSRLG
jgi:Domain of unknown function (DUF4345)